MIDPVLLDEHGHGRCGCRLVKLTDHAHLAMLPCPKHSMTTTFTVDDAKRHRRAAKVASDVLDVRKATKLARAMGHVIDSNDDFPGGGKNVDAQLADRFAWHTSMAARLEAVLQEAQAGG